MPYVYNTCTSHLQAFKHLIPSYPAPQRHWRSSRSLVGSSLRRRRAPHEAALQQLRLFFLTHRRIRGDPIFMFKITVGLLEFPMESTFTHPTRTGLHGHAYKFHQQRCRTHRRQYAFSIWAVPFLNKLLAEIVNASSVKSFKTLLDKNWVSLFPNVPI